jgi:pimeloyl-ACP methyl ester carboxylesterase
MLSLSRARLVPTLALLATGLLLPAGAAWGQAAQKPKTKNVPFESFDGVKLSGTLYPNPGGKREAVVLLLHDFDLKKGGSSQQAGWTNLAASLHKDGYVVFMFDFRGFGDSKTLANKDRFWGMPHNSLPNIKRSAFKRESLDHKDFMPGYLAYLANDVAAAKAYLDRRNDNKELNSSNLIVIGAGEGATVGAMWLANECRRRKDKSGLNIGVPAQMGDPEVRDVAAAIWLTIGPKIGSRNAPLTRWVMEAGKEHKVPTLFVFGKNDKRGDDLSMRLYKDINPKGEKNKDLKRTGRRIIPDTKLTGESLLGVDETIPAIRDHLKDVLEDRGSRESSKREADKYRYVYTIKGRYIKDNKKAGEEVPSVDVNFILGR